MIFNELSPSSFDNSEARLCCNKRTARYGLANTSVAADHSAFVARSKKSCFFFPLLTSVKFSISLTEVNFYIGFLLDDIMWCLKGLGKAGLR